MSVCRRPGSQGVLTEARVCNELAGAVAGRVRFVARQVQQAGLASGVLFLHTNSVTWEQLETLSA